MEYTLTLPDDFNTTDIRDLLENDWLLPRKVRHLLRTRKNVLLNGEPVLFHETVKAGDQLTLIFEESDYDKPIALLGNKELVEVLFEDEHLIIVNKPYGMKTHPNQPLENNTLFNHVAAYLGSQELIPYVVHRLDMETSGAILFAKNPFVLPILGKMLESKEINRRYQGIARGKFSQANLTINKKIGRDRHDKRKRIINHTQGQEAITHVTVDHFEAGRSYLYCLLETGRTHQIRVHLQSVGHPLLGDPLYHPNPKQVDRLMLHAESLSFIHPFTKKEITVQALHGLW